MTGFKDDIALVTGAAGGIGRGVARALGAAGAQVLAADVVDCAEVAAEIVAAGGEAQSIDCDLATLDGWQDLLSEVMAGGKPPTVFVHSASPRRIESQTVLQVTPDEWDEMLNINLRSGFFLAQGIARELVAREMPGRLMFVASLHAHTPRNLAHYSAAKSGQVMLVKELARALAPKGIRVNAVAPGAIPGGGFAGDFEALSQMIPMGRPGTPEDVAKAVMALLDPALDYVTGAVLPVDGGIDTYNWLPRPEAP